MTKKDYIKIVEMLAGCVEEIGAENVYKAGYIFANKLADDNPRFSHEKFQSYLSKCVGGENA